MKRASIALTALIMLGLTGCSGAVEETPSEPLNSVQSAPEETPAPLVAETSEPDVPGDAEATFVVQLRDMLRPNNVIPNATDEQLIAAGKNACAQLDADVNPDDLTVIEGEERNSGGYYEDSGVIATAARMFLCPA